MAETARRMSATLRVWVTFQAIDCTGTDNQKQSNTTLHTPETQKRNRKNCHSQQNNLHPDLVRLIRPPDRKRSGPYSYSPRVDTNRSMMQTAYSLVMWQCQQVTWLVVTEVRSESYGLVTECRHYNARHINARRCYVSPVLFSSSIAVSRAFSVLCAYLTFWYHPHPLGYPCAKFYFCCSSTAELGCGEKSRTQSLTQSLTQLIWYVGNRSFDFGTITS